MFVWTKEHKFRRNSLLTTHYSLLTTQKRLEDVNTNSRGLSSLRYFNVRILVASVKTRIGNSHRTSASSRRHFFFLSIIPRVQEPAAIRPTGFPSSRRFFPTNIYHNVMLNLFNFVQFAHAQSQISASHRESGTAKKPFLMKRQASESLKSRF